LESLDSKLTKLKNAWDEFAMSLADNGLLKFAVDFLTNILTAINKLGDMVGPLKGVVSLLTTIAALKLGKNVLNKVFDPIQKALDKKIKHAKGEEAKEDVEEAQDKAKEDLSPEMTKKGDKEATSWGEAFKKKAFSIWDSIKAKFRKDDLWEDDYEDLEEKPTPKAETPPQGKEATPPKKEVS
jgi:hypothetical protein